MVQEVPGLASDGSLDLDLCTSMTTWPSSSPTTPAAGFLSLKALRLGPKVGKGGPGLPIPAPSSLTSPTPSRGAQSSEADLPPPRCRPLTPALAPHSWKALVPAARPSANCHSRPGSCQPPNPPLHPAPSSSWNRLPWIPPWPTLSLPLVLTRASLPREALVSARGTNPSAALPVLLSSLSSSTVLI